MNRIRPVSKKRAAENRRRKQVTDAMKREGPVMCAFEEPIDEVSVMSETFVAYAHCGRRADDAHEIVSRARGGSIMDPVNLLPLCREHHRWVTEHPIEAEKLGLSKRKEN